MQSDIASAGILKASPYDKMPAVERDNKRRHCLPLQGHGSLSK